MSHSRKRPNAKLRQPIKRHGGKAYLASKIVSLMPPRVKNSNSPAPNDRGWLHYRELFFGGGAVLLESDPDGISEVVNDIDGDLTKFWRVLRSKKLFPAFVRMCEATPCARSSYDEAVTRLRRAPVAAKARGYLDDCVERAWAFFVVNRQSRQALGKGFATIVRNRTRRAMNELPAAWLSSIDGLLEVHARFRRVVILNDDAVRVIRQQDGARTLFYIDPPYVHATRTVPDAYAHEMTVEDHRRLLETLVGIKGRFLLSGYRCHLYDRFAAEHGWSRVDFAIDNKSGSGAKKQKRTESVWRNYD